MTGDEFSRLNALLCHYKMIETVEQSIEWIEENLSCCIRNDFRGDKRETLVRLVECGAVHLRAELHAQKEALQFSTVPAESEQKPVVDHAPGPRRINLPAEPLEAFQHVS